MKKEIVYTDKYALILSDEIPTKVYYDTYIHQLKHTGGAEYGESSIAKTVVGHLPLADDVPILEGVPLLPSFSRHQEDDVNKLAYEQWKEPDYRSGNPPYIYGIGFNEGYNKAKEKYKYTEADLEIAMNWLFETKGRKGLEDLIERLNQPSRPTHFECEMEITHEGNGTYSTDLMDIGVSNLVPINIPKTTTNSQGYIELVGKYLNL